MVVDNPRVGLTHARCPHCRTPHNFTERTLAADEKGVLVPLDVDHNGVKCLSTLQVCAGCHKKIMFIDEQMAYPWRLLPDADLLYLPEDLRNFALDGYQLVDTTPALSAAALRRALERLCVAAGWTSGIFATYVDFLADTLRQSTDAEAHALLGSLAQYCKDGEAPIPANRIRWDRDDNPACVMNLMKLIDKAAWLLRAALPTTQPPTAFISHAAAPKRGPA